MQRITYPLVQVTDCVRIKSLVRRPSLKISLLMAPFSVRISSGKPCPVPCGAHPAACTLAYSLDMYPAACALANPAASLWALADRGLSARSCSQQLATAPTRLAYKPQANVALPERTSCP